MLNLCIYLVDTQIQALSYLYIHPFIQSVIVVVVHVFIYVLTILFL